MSKAKDIQDESVVRLREWLDFIESKKAELKGQIERLRQKETKEGKTAEEAPSVFSGAPISESVEVESEGPPAEVDDASKINDDDPWL
jgi:hypothetical protein